MFSTQLNLWLGVIFSVNIYYCLQIMQHYNTDVQTCELQLAPTAAHHCPIIQCWIRTSEGSHSRAQKDPKLSCFMLLLGRTHSIFGPCATHKSWSGCASITVQCNLDWVLLYDRQSLLCHEVGVVFVQKCTIIIINSCSCIINNRHLLPRCFDKHKSHNLAHFVYLENAENVTSL